MSDIKSMLDSIINDTNNSYTGVVDNPIANAIDYGNTDTFNKAAYREKLSKVVIKDLLSAMMNDETKNLDAVIDASIMRHINDNYNGSCYTWLSTASKSLNGSPLVTSVIQEINAKTDACAQKICESKDASIADDAVSVKDLLRDVSNYDELRERIKEVVTEKVVKDVAGVITAKNDAPVFDDIDDKFKNNEVGEEEEDGELTESVIVNVAGSIVTEFAVEHKQRLSTDEGITRAIVEYCVNEVDILFKLHPRYDIYTRYMK